MKSAEEAAVSQSDVLCETGTELERSAGSISRRFNGS
jgi:hypothetical protein